LPSDLHVDNRANFVGPYGAQVFREQSLPGRSHFEEALDFCRNAT
jgi:hypothetical protein